MWTIAYEISQDLSSPRLSVTQHPETDLVEPASVAVPIEPNERLFVPNRKRLTHTYLTNSDGVRELRIDYGVKEVTFDDERFFPFGEQLVREASFTGEMAVNWGPSYAWDELQPLLDVLLAEGIIKRGHGVDDARGDGRGGLVPGLTLPSVCPKPRMWSLAECESISHDLTGQAFEIGHIEAIVPIFRIVHPALDADQRQIGEGNVFPYRLRLEIETEWRVCQYSGSRYRDDAPMNVSGLRAMIKHWKPMMKTLLQVRGEVRSRLGPSDHWTIGELYVMSAIALCLPTYQLMKGGGTSPQRPVHPVMSSLFRITDGIRMTTYNMLFATRNTRSGDELLTAAQLYDHAETQAILIGSSGVCAGPKPLIDEFLTTVIDGIRADGIDEVELPAEVLDLLAELPAAVDYGLLGLMVRGTAMSIWLAMCRTYEAILPIFDAMPTDHPGCAKLQARIHTDWSVLEKLQVGTDHDRDVHHEAYAHIYAQSWCALRTKVGPPQLAQAIAPRPDGPVYQVAADQLRAIFKARCAHGELAGGCDAPAIEGIVEALVYLLRHEHAILASTSVLLEEINSCLDRPRAKRPLSIRDLLAFYVLDAEPGWFPYVFNTLEAELGIHVASTTTDVTITDRRAS
jgi:hypothetical protein